MKKGIKNRYFLLSLMTVIILSLTFFIFTGNPFSQRAFTGDIPEGCTSIIVGRLASTDGSTMTSHTCDGYGARTWVNVVPHATHDPGSLVTIYAGQLFSQSVEAINNLRIKGGIPQVNETYAYLNTAYPSMNEYQLAIGETTIGGRRELRSDKGIFLIEELQKIVLQRTKTAREAIKLMGKLAEEYGYIDTGECMTFIDPKEAWHFEIFGPGRGNFGAVWAAVRIPDDHVGVSANIPRIAEIDSNDSDNYLASDNVFSLAEEMGWWDPDSGEPFKMWKAYSGRKPFSIREYWILSTLAPSLNLKYDSEELPFSVKPDKKVSPRDVMSLFRETYAGSEYDITKNLKVKNRRTGEVATSPIVHAWMSADMRNLLNEIKPGIAVRYRPIAVEYCAYSTVIQARDWLPDPIGGICWLGFHNPAMTPRMPVFAGVNKLPEDFNISAHHRFSRESAAWAFRRTARLAQFRWGYTKDIIQKTLHEFEEKAFLELPGIEKKAVELYNENPEKAREYLTAYTNDFCRAMTHRYWELGDQLWTIAAR